LCQFFGSRRDTHVAGTAAYVAPETMQRGTTHLGADVFAFGILAYFAATAHLPFNVNNVQELLEQKAGRHNFFILDPTQFNPKMPAGLNLLIQRCLDQDPEQRYANMTELIEELAFVY